MAIVSASEENFVGKDKKLHMMNWRKRAFRTCNNGNCEPITTQYCILMHYRYIAVENIVRKGEIACDKQFLLFSQCFPSYMVLIFHFKCTLTLSQTANFRPFQTERVCRRQFRMWWKWHKVLQRKVAESSPNMYKTLQEKEKLLVTSNFSFSRIVFKSLVLQKSCTADT